MFNAKIDISDLIAKANALTDGAFSDDLLNAVADEAVIPELAKEPFRATRKRMIFTSAKQRAFVMAAIRTGDIEVPYRRTGNIGISVKHHGTNSIDVESTADYSDYVRTKGKQARYHEGTWETTDTIAERLERDVVEVIATAHVVQALDKAGLT